jgi:acyl carrier protein
MKNNLDIIINDLLSSNNKPNVTILNDNDDLINDIGFDSLELAELTVIIEEQYGVDIFEHKVIRTVGEIKEILKNE